MAKKRKSSKKSKRASGLKTYTVTTNKVRARTKTAARNKVHLR